MDEIKYKRKDEKIGEIKYNKFNTPMKLIGYKNTFDCTVEFQDEYKYVFEHANYQNFLQGKIKNPYDKTIQGIGMLGDGEYMSRYVRGGHTKEYHSWNDMLIRCYRNKEKYPSYYEISTVCDEWLNYQNFAKWYNENRYYIPNDERLHLDKDILIPGNKHYSPETCMLVPQKINMLFSNKSKVTKSGLPNGIHQSANGEKYMVMYNKEYIGCFEVLKKAYEYYAKEKQKAIKQRAEEYKEYIPNKLYVALLRYEVKMEYDKNYEANI